MYRRLPLILVIAFVVAACEIAGGADPFAPPKVADFSALTWTMAFDAMHEKISTEYAFTAWKRINWTQMKTEFRPRIETAEAAGDTQAYYRTVREYLFRIPDGHIGMSVTTDGQNMFRQENGGGFGLAVAHLDNGRLVAHWVKEGGSAAGAGMQAGAQIIGWGGKPAIAALKETSSLWTSWPQATDTGSKYERTRFMVRAPVGTSKQVVFRNPGESFARKAALLAVDDSYESLTIGTARSATPSPDGQFHVIDHGILSGGVGYMKIYYEADLPGDPPTLDLFSGAVQEFIDNDVKGIIVDVRDNTGGSDQMVADFMSSFYDEECFYEYQNWYNLNTGKMEIILADDETGDFADPGKGIFIQPGTPRFEGPVITLVNGNCISSGEGVAMGIKNLPQGRVVGFRGTDGSFGMVLSPMITMPNGFEVTYPVGQSLDKNKRIQLDSRNGRGGVTPTDRVPMTLVNALQWGAGYDVELEHALKVLASCLRQERHRR